MRKKRKVKGRRLRRDCSSNSENSVIIFSSFTRDIINGSITIGGPAYYCTLALMHMDVEKIIVVTNAEEVHMKFLRNLGISSYIVNTIAPLFRLKYLDGERRRIELLRTSPTLSIPHEILDLISGCLVIVSPVYHEIELELLRALRSRSRIIALDVQGFTRSLGPNGEVVINWSNELLDVIALADIVHADLSEVPTCRTGLEATKYLSEHTDGLVIVSMGARGLIASANGDRIYIPALPHIHGDSTGTGDILLAVSSYEILIGEDWKLAIAKGAAAAGLKVSRSRPPWFNKYEVEVLARSLLRASKAV